MNTTGTAGGTGAGGARPIAGSLRRGRLAAVAAVVAALVWPAAVQADAGDLDTSFGTNGTTRTPFGGSNSSDTPDSILRQRDGKLVVAGGGGPLDAQDFLVVRYTASGRHDTSFSGDGLDTVDFGGNDNVAAAFLRRDGKLVVAGETATNPQDGRLAVARYNTDGTLDTSFSGGRRVSPFFPGTRHFLNDVEMLPGGGFVAVGPVFGAGSDGTDMGIAKYRRDGSLDPSFGGGDGLALVGFTRPGGTDNAFDVLVQRDGKLVVTGNFQTGPAPNGFDVGIARLESDGDLDSTFAGDGRRWVAFDDEPGNDRGVRTVQQRDGKLVTVAYAIVNGGQDIGLIRLRTNGVLDRRFSGDGRQTTDFAGLPDFGNNLRLQPDGRIVVVGTGLLPGAGVETAVLRYLRNGELDPSFGDGGKRTFSQGPAVEAAVNLLADAAAITVAGYVEGGDTGRDFTISRLLGDRAALSLTARERPATVDRGETVAYDLSVANDGPETAADVRLRLRLPRGFRLVSVSGLRGDRECRGRRVVTCPLGDVPAGEGLEGRAVTVEASATRRGRRTAFASVRSATLDPDRSDNSARITTVVR